MYHSGNAARQRSRHGLSRPEVDRYCGRHQDHQGELVLPGRRCVFDCGLFPVDVAGGFFLCDGRPGFVLGDLGLGIGLSLGDLTLEPCAG